MRRRRRLGSRSKRYRRRWPSIVGWSLGVLAGIGALAAVAYVHGNPYDEKSESFFTALHVALARPAVSAALGFGGLLLIAWSARHLTLEALSWWPGKVVVEDFTAGPEIEDANVARLTAAFRNRLAESHLQAPASVPAAAPQGNFIDVLSGGGTEPGALLSTLAGLLRAALPDHAYEVKGVLVTREQEPRCGVTVQVERLPGQAGPAQTFWRSSWDRAIVRAADHATASIVPRTRRCHAPWAGWRGYHLPSRLVHNYERAAELEAERRFDEALDAYYDALKDDPMNLCLRLQIGFLQEKLALFLDAFATYEGILAVAQPGRAKENDGRSAKAKAKVPRPRRARRHGVDRLGSTYRGAARRDREQVLLVTHYRRAILLAGSEFPRQWRRGAAGKPNLRDKQRTQLRERLRPRLEHELAKAGGSTPTRTEVEEMLAEPARTRAGTPVSASESPTELDVACLQAASASFDKLEHLTPTWSLRRSTALTRSTVKLSSLWTAQRLQRVRAELGQVEGGHAEVSQLTGKIKEIEKHAHGFRRWQDHYNAACVYSLPLLAGAPADADEHARLAVDYLERAIGCADSGFVALHRDWVLADDPDLEGLREHRRFKQFEAMFFPSPARTRTRPPGLHRWELSHYTIDLLCSTADRWEGLWESRRTDLGASPAHARAARLVRARVGCLGPRAGRGLQPPSLAHAGEADRAGGRRRAAPRVRAARGRLPALRGRHRPGRRSRPRRARARERPAPARAVRHERRQARPRLPADRGPAVAAREPRADRRAGLEGAQGRRRADLRRARRALAHAAALPHGRARGRAAVRAGDRGRRVGLARCRGGLARARLGSRPAAARPAAAQRAPPPLERQVLIRSDAPIAPPRSPSSASTNGGGFSLANRCGSMAFSIFSR